VPVLAHNAPQPVVPGVKYPVEIEILPSSTFFEAGSQLVLTLKGRDITNSRLIQHKILFNQGRHSVWAGSIPHRLVHWLSDGTWSVIKVKTQ